MKKKKEVKVKTKNYKNFDYSNENILNMINGRDFSYKDYVDILSFFIYKSLRKNFVGIRPDQFDNMHAELYSTIQEKLLSKFDQTKVKPITFIYLVIHNWVFDQKRKYEIRDRLHGKAYCKFEDAQKIKITDYLTMSYTKDTEKMYELFDKYFVDNMFRGFVKNDFEPDKTV
jgi:hypothetical protein